MEKEYLNDEDEQQHFERIVKSFKAYHYHASKRVTKSFSCYQELSDKHKDYLPEFKDNCNAIIKCIDQNNEIIRLLIKDVNDIFQNKSKEEPDDADSLKINDETETDIELMNPRLNLDVDRVYTTLKQIVRDWSKEGESERESYKLILTELKNLYPNPKKNETESISVLVPGAGLGRLAFEIARLGFKCQGNEFSLHMLITSNFILNKCDEIEQFTIYPYANSWSNNLKFNDQIRPVKFPDISPSEFSSDLFQFSMTAGDFQEIYNEKDEWNCIVTCFFIDTAHNVIDYIEKIWHILKSGGKWINFGPLMYHYSDISYEKSIELSYEQTRSVIEKMGFKFLKEETNLESRYIDNRTSMLRYKYDCVFFICEKP